MDCLSWKTSSISRRVLIVEDNPDSRQTLQLLLELWGHQVRVAEDGLAGIQTALSWRPDVAIVDIGLPIRDGFEVAQEVRKKQKDILLIALTGFGQPENRRKALAAGFNVYMTKPANLEELTQLLADRDDVT
jgi:CheY-like chemotaxis protein